MMNNPRTLITKNVKNGVTNKSNASGTFVRNHFSNLAPIIPTKNAGNTVPWYPTTLINPKNKIGSAPPAATT